jgi:glyoxylate carboligase
MPCPVLAGRERGKVVFEPQLDAAGQDRSGATNCGRAGRLGRTLPAALGVVAADPTATVVGPVTPVGY